MKNLTFNEFRSSLGQYLKEIEGGKTICVRGKKIAFAGYLEENVRTSDRRTRKPQVTSHDNTYVIEAPAYSWHCEICNREAHWRAFDDSGERIVCDPCVRKKAGKMYKSIIRYMRKV